jgi:hypothetical protein
MKFCFSRLRRVGFSSSLPQMVEQMRRRFLSYGGSMLKVTQIAHDVGRWKQQIYPANRSVPFIPILEVMIWNFSPLLRWRYLYTYLVTRHVR